ncbi:hypothetical protein B6U91_02205 [Candidatus Pacearchaeota archaeon ex4484_71]|nr:MAG: hypothetical protein B6U91_02205 [Candidatus Pacearchaeota archaeon ex4484_71]
MLSKKRNKKGQVGDTLTWIVSTIIVVVMLLIFIFVSSLLAETKFLGKYREKIVSPETELKYDLILSKSLYAYYTLENVKEKNAFYAKLEALENKGYFSDSLEERSKEIRRGLLG